MDTLGRQGKIHTARRYKSICRRLKKYCEGSLPFDEITPQLLRRYDVFLVEEHNNKQSTRASVFRGIRAILYRAIRDGLAKQENNPFFHFKVKEGKTKRKRLSTTQIQSRYIRKLWMAKEKAYPDCCKLTLRKGQSGHALWKSKIT